MKLTSNQRGFTLIELLAAMAIGGMLLSVLVTSTFQTMRVSMASDTQITALEDIRFKPWAFAPPQDCYLP